jgi:hypothetical protein
VPRKEFAQSNQAKVSQIRVPIRIPSREGLKAQARDFIA